MYSKTEDIHTQNKDPFPPSISPTSGEDVFHKLKAFFSEITAIINLNGENVASNNTSGPGES